MAALKDRIVNPKHPERICWGCEGYCPAHDLICGNGTIRTPHPIELFGKDWLEWADDHDTRKTGDASRKDDSSRACVSPRT